MEQAIPSGHKTHRPCLPLEANHNILLHRIDHWKENKQAKQIVRVQDQFWQVLRAFSVT